MYDVRRLLRMGGLCCTHNNCMDIIHQNGFICMWHSTACFQFPQCRKAMSRIRPSLLIRFIAMNTCMRFQHMQHEANTTESNKWKSYSAKHSADVQRSSVSPLVSSKKIIARRVMRWLRQSVGMSVCPSHS